MYHGISWCAISSVCWWLQIPAPKPLSSCLSPCPHHCPCRAPGKDPAILRTWDRTYHSVISFSLLIAHYTRRDHQCPYEMPTICCDYCFPVNYGEVTEVHVGKCHLPIGLSRLPRAAVNKQRWLGYIMTTILLPVSWAPRLQSRPQ